MIQFKVNAYYIDNYKAIFIVKRSAKSVTFTDAFGKTHRKPIKIIAGNECISGKLEGSYFANLEISAMRAKQLMQKEVDMWRKINDEQEAEYAETYGVVDDVHDDDFEDCTQEETTEIKALPATASQPVDVHDEKSESQPEKKNDSHKNIQGEYISTFSFSYTKGKEKKEIALRIFKYQTRDLKMRRIKDEEYFGESFLIFFDEKDNTMFCYFPYMDCFQFYPAFFNAVDCNRYNHTKKRACEKQLRKILSGILKNAGYLDQHGNFICDDNGAFRILAYKYALDKKDMREIQLFLMPDKPFTDENDKDNPLSWPADSNERKQAMRLFFRIMDITNNQMYSCNEGDKKAYLKEIDSLREEIRKLFETQNESLQATASETQEAWIKVAHELGYSWKRAQFIKGCIILKEYDAYKKELEQKHKRYATLSGSQWLYEIYSPSLKSIRELAASFGVDVHDDKNHKNRIEKRIFISRILSTLIFCDMNCVFTRTYIVQNPPALPPELTEHSSKHAPEQTRMPRKRIQVTAESISSCQNENDALSILMTLKKEDMKNIARDKKISIHSSRRFKINWFMSKEQIARYIAHQLFLRRKIQAKKTSNLADDPKTNKLENFSYSTNKKTGQISFIFE